MLAAYCEGRRWVFEGDAEVKSKFWGRSIELTPMGLLKLTFADGDTYTWNKVRSGPLPPFTCKLWGPVRCSASRNCWNGTWMSEGCSTVENSRGTLALACRHLGYCGQRMEPPHGAACQSAPPMQCS